MERLEWGRGKNSLGRGLACTEIVRGRSRAELYKLRL